MPPGYASNLDCPWMDRELRPASIGWIARACLSLCSFIVPVCSLVYCGLLFRIVWFVIICCSSSFAAALCCSCRHYLLLSAAHHLLLALCCLSSFAARPSLPLGPLFCGSFAAVRLETKCLWWEWLFERLMDLELTFVWSPISSFPTCAKKSLCEKREQFGFPSPFFLTINFFLCV